MYVGVPVLAKWLTVENTGTDPVSVDKTVIEFLGTQKPYVPQSLAPLSQPWEHDASAVTSSWLYIEANVPHGASVQWMTDPASGSSPGADEPLLNCTYTVGPGLLLANTENARKFTNRTNLRQQESFSTKGETKTNTLTQFETYHVLELVTDSSDLERVALSRHRMTRLLAPQTQENPIFFHGTDSSSAGFKNSIDQMAIVGFEMYIFSFGSGFNLEDLSQSNLDAIAADVQYAKSKGIEVGGYVSSN